jgi:hypothetical protein
MCTPCLKSQKVISGTGCANCDAGKVMDATNDQACSSCTGNTIASDGVCTPCDDLYKTTDNIKCEYCGGYGWSGMFKGLSSTDADDGDLFMGKCANYESIECKSNGPGPQVICYATWKIKFTESTDNLCFTATQKVDDQVAIYIKDIGPPVGFPKYFDQRGCACNGGCACMTDYPFLMDFDSTWGKKNSLQWWYRGGTGQKCMKIDVAKDSERLLVMWFFSEDEGAGKQGLKLDTSTAFKAQNTC